MPAFEPILLRNLTVERAWDIDVYLGRGGYQAVRQALTAHQPAEIIDMVKRSGLRGRGGAGFPTGMKWDFVPKDPALQKYVCCNADESEPGTFSNRALLEYDPHQLIEGIVICAYAIGASRSFVYVRGEYALGADRLEAAIGQARERGYLGRNILGSGFDHDITVFRGAGAYICGEETALLESLEGNRPMPRSRPPFPAVAGLYAKPTVINNVETLCNVPHIIANGVEWYTAIGVPPRNTGPKIYSLSGRVKRPGNYELPLGVPLRELIYEHGGGIVGDRRVKAIVPGGTSAALLTAEHLDLPMDFDAVAQAGSMLGTAGVIVMDETVCIPCAVQRMMEFYNHESCGKCTPCREGTLWLLKLLRRITRGEARSADIDLMREVCGGIGGKVLCALAEGAIAPVLSSIRYFRDEYEHHIKYGTCPTKALAGR
jgi:NADH-quinone oxidoreductase subunit F